MWHVYTFLWCILHRDHSQQWPVQLSCSSVLCNYASPYIKRNTMVEITNPIWHAVHLCLVDFFPPCDADQLWECCFLIIGQYICYPIHGKEMPLGKCFSYKSYHILHPAYLPKSQDSVGGFIPFYGCKASEEGENKGKPRQSLKAESQFQLLYQIGLLSFQST